MYYYIPGQISEAEIKEAVLKLIEVGLIAPNNDWVLGSRWFYKLLKIVQRYYLLSALFPGASVY